MKLVRQYSIVSSEIGHRQYSIVSSKTGHRQYSIVSSEIGHKQYSIVSSKTGHRQYSIVSSEIGHKQDINVCCLESTAALLHKSVQNCLEDRKSIYLIEKKDINKFSKKKHLTKLKQTFIYHTHICTHRLKHTHIQTHTHTNTQRHSACTHTQQFLIKNKN